MKKRWMSFGLSVLMLVMAILPVSATESVDDIKKDKNRAQQQVSALETQLQQILDELDELDIKIENKRSEIEKVSEELLLVSEKEDKQYEDMKLRIQYMYEEGSSSFWGTLFESESFTEFMNKAEYVQNVHDYDRDQLNAYMETKKEVAEIKKKLESEQADMLVLEEQMQKQQDGLGIMVEEKKNEVSNLNQQLVEAVEEAARKAEEERLEKQRQLEEEQRAKEQEERQQAEEQRLKKEQAEAQKSQKNENKQESDEPQEKEDTIQIPSGDGVAFIDVVKAVSGQMLSDGNWKYSNSNVKKSFEAARNASKRVSNCAHFVSLCMQEYGSLNKGMTFYGNSSGEIHAGSSVKKTLEKNCYVINMGKISVTSATLEPGDVCVWTGQHTNIYAGKDKNGKLCWYDAGGDMTSKGYFNRFYKSSNFTSRKLSYVIRMK